MVCVAYSTSELLDISIEVVRYSVLQSIHSSQTLAAIIQTWAGTFQHERKC